jgi:transcriptional regulator with XRE-family HTH domain
MLYLGHRKVMSVRRQLPMQGQSMELGEALRRARKHLHLSQLEAASQLHISMTTYQRWEWGKAVPQPYHRRVIEAFFGETWRTLGISLPMLSPGEAETAGADDQDGDRCLANGSTSPESLLPEEHESESDEPQDLIKSHMTSYLWHLAHLPHPTLDEKRCQIRQAIEECDRMNSTNKNHQISRREALCTLATLPMITLSLSLPGTTLEPKRYGDFLAHCAASLEACYALSEGDDASDIAFAFKSVSKYLPILERIAREAIQFRQEALDLATRYALLQTILGWHYRGSTETIQYARHAVTLSKEMGNISFQLSAYSKLAWAYFYDKKYKLALETAQEAQFLLDRSSTPLPPCIQAGTYSTLALMQAKNGKPIDLAVGKAIEIDAGDESYAFMEFTRSDQPEEIGLIYTSQGDQSKAMEWLEKLIDPVTLTEKIPRSLRGRISVINSMAQASLKTKNRDMEKTVHLWTAAIGGAKALRSEWGFNEVMTTYELMDVVWPAEPRIKDLRDLIVHW